MSSSESYFPTLSPIARGIWAGFRCIGRGIRKLARVTWKPILVLAIILALAHSIAGFVLGRRVESEIRAIKARGEPVSMVELGLPKVPDAENAAIPYAKAFEELTGMVLNPKGGPPLSSSSDSREDRQIIANLLSEEERAKDPHIWDKARQIVEKHQKVIPLIEEAVSRPHCQFPVNWKDGPGALFPHFMPMREMSRFLRANALLAARDGDMDRAVQYVELGFGASESLKDEPTLIGQLVRMAMVKITSKSLREVLTYGEIDESSARELADVLAGMDMRPGLYKAMLGERAFGLGMFEMIADNPARFNMLANMSYAAKPWSGRAIAWHYLARAWRPFLYADERIYLRLMTKQIRIMQLPWREARARLESLDASRSVPRYAIMCSIVLPVFTRCNARRDETQAEVGACRIILGLHVYKQPYGTYPQALDGLRSLGWDVPEDPFSGRDFVYKPRGGGYLFYSIGQDLKDGGAKTFFPRRPLTAAQGPPSMTQPEVHDYKAPNGWWADDMIWASER